MQPGTTLELTVDALGSGGDGIARTDGAVVYLPLTAPGDRVRASLVGRRGAAWAGRVEAVLDAGSDRVVPSCPHFGDCGGCASQHLSEAANRHWKQEMIQAALRARGLDPASVRPVVATSPASRRRATVAVQRRAKRLEIGFQVRRARRIVDLASCDVLLPDITSAIVQLRDGLADVLRAGEGCDIHLCASDSGLDLWLQADRPLDLDGRTALAALADRLDAARVSWGRAVAEAVVVRRTPVVQFGAVTVSIPPGAFLQASAEGEAILCDLVRAGVGDAGTILDLFAGCGTFAFALADRARVQAYERAEDHVAALVQAARTLSRRNVTADQRDLFRRPVDATALNKIDAVVFDPPRAGARAQAQMLAQSSVPVVVAVSCNPGTFARDARILVDGGYRLDWAAPLDQFPWSPHVELVARFGR